GRAFVAGVEAKQTDVGIRADANGFEIERFAIADFGGAGLAVKGRIDSKTQSPRGVVALDLDVRALDGVMALLEKLAPQTAEQLRRAGGRLTPAALRASLSVDPATAGSANAKFKIEGRAGSFRVALQGDAGTASDAFKLENLAALAAAKLNLNGRLDADDGAALIELMGLDRFIAVDKRPARLVVAAKGPLDGDLGVDVQLAAGALNVATKGTIRVPVRASPSAELNLKVTNANIRSPRQAAGRASELLPASATARLAWNEGTLRFSEAAGRVAGASVGGRLALGMQQRPITVDGDIELGSVDLPAAVALAIGVPAQGAASGAGAGAATSASAAAFGPWPAEPFEQGLAALSGQIAVKSARVALTPKLAARDVRGVVRFGESELALEGIDGSIAGGRVAADLTFLRRAEGLAARGRLRLTGANAGELLPGEGSLSGRLTIDVSAEGSGMSPIALVGSLAGSGSFTLENARAARLDPAAFDTVIRAVDQGLPIDAIRVRDRMDGALASGGLAVTLAEGAIAIDAGQARLSNPVVRAQRGDLAVSGSVNLAEAAIDARLTLFGSGGAGAPADTRPEIGIALKGPIDTPKRTIDVAALTSWLALRAVEQQSKKLDMLEGRAPVPSLVPAAVNTTSAPKPQSAAPAAEGVQPLPPPIDVRPAPAPRVPRAPRPQPGAAAPQGAPAQAQKPPPAPARPPSLSEILFGFGR
ncbi:MAG: hypothetical protein JO049_20570, partial [Hyphomicrobiales bacterium]|nr:hypothetical protein [Hyphomicrobiales bacterium]